MYSVDPVSGRSENQYSGVEEIVTEPMAPPVECSVSTSGTVIGRAT